VFGGERVLVSDVRIVRELFSRSQVLTGLGSTETGAVRHIVVDRDVPLLGKVVPLGYPVEDVEVVLLDETGEPVGDHTIGEITIRSRYIAREYWHNPHATAKAFARDASDPAVIIYRTGDLGRRLADGMLVHHGRKDFQVKVRGFRIETQEVETAVLEHPALSEAVVVAHPDGAGENRLVAYLVARQGEAVTAEALRRFLQPKLPEYMLPSTFLLLPAMPLTPNGKIDRQALPQPDTGPQAAAGESAAPHTATEKQLAEIWAQLLHLPQVGRHDDFFALGGHSLLATQVVTRSRSLFGVDVPMRVLFEKTTLAELAAYIDAHCGPQGADAAEWRTITPMPQEAPIPLSFAQLRMWLLEKLYKNSAAYNIINALRLAGPLDVAAMRKSINTLVQRHEILRTVFGMNDDQAVQHVNPYNELKIPLIDLQELPPQDGVAIAHTIIEREAQHHFDLETGPLLRCAVIRLSPDDHILVMNVCHLIFDNIWSAGVFFRELAVCYEAYSTGTALCLPPLPIQYRDYAYWQQHSVPAEELSSQLQYWRQKLADAPPSLPLPTDYPRPLQPTFKGGRVAFQFPKSLLNALNHLSQECGVTLFMTLLAAWKVLLFCYSKQQDIVVGTPIGNRQQVETEPLIGLFINTLVLRTDLGGNPTFKTLVRRVRETALGAYANQDVPYEQLVFQLQPKRRAGVSPFFQVLFIFQNAAVSACRLPGLQTTRLDVHGDSAKCDLTLSVMESETGLSGNLEYSSDLFQRHTIEQMLSHFHTLLLAIVANPDEAITCLPLLTSGERQQLPVD
jgi:hypothetical protein